MHTFWTTFYSYKGGVGRSMALANVAAHLASKGRRVLMIDFDLEAPGLDSFEEFAIPPGTQGLVEYVCSYIDTGRPAKIDQFVYEIEPVDINSDRKDATRHLEGKLWLMTSGAKDDAYNKKRLSIDWAELYEKNSGADFIENFKADVEETYKPDYVLVDSRTGLTDVGGVCTVHLPDLVILLFALNEQNIKGIAAVARVLRNSERVPQLIPVATPVPNLERDRDSPLEARFQRAKELLGVEVTRSINYSPFVALKEELIVWEDYAMPGGQYRALAKDLMMADPAGIDFLQREAMEALEAMDLERADEIGQELEADYGDRADAWLTLADIAKANGDPKTMETDLRRSLKISPNSASAYNRIEAILRGKNREEDLLDLVNELLDLDSKLEPNFEKELHRDAGNLCMKTGRPGDAIPHYEAVMKVGRSENDSDDEDDIPSFGPLFSIEEAKRRASGKIEIASWQKLIALFEDASAKISALPLADRANYSHAMHICYACVGNLDRARSLLDETSQTLEGASRNERVYTVADYDYHKLEEFLELNSQMREALDRCELWDGMKLNF